MRQKIINIFKFIITTVIKFRFCVRYDILIPF